MKFTILLLRPDYVTEGSEPDTYATSVEAEDLDSAIVLAKEECEAVDEQDYGDDLKVLCALEGEVRFLL